MLTNIRMQQNRNKRSRALVCLAWSGFALAQAQAGLDAYAQEAPQVTATDVEQQNVPKPPAASFDLLELRVKGNTLLDKKQLERTIYPFLGLKKSIDNVDLARSALEEFYRAKGYQTVMVDIPEQDVTNGIVYLNVVEGKVSRLRVTESRYFSLGKIKAGVPELAEGKVPNFPVMQKQLTELGGESADRKVQPILRAGETPGTLEVDLKVKDELPLHGRVELNGRNTYGTSRLRLVSSLHYDNLWQKMHSASLMYQVSPEISQEVSVWAGTYAMPVFNTDMRLALYGVNSSSTSNVASVGGTTIIGTGSIYGARLVKPLPALDNYFHSATLGADYKDFKENLTLNSPGGYKTPISYLPFLAQYSGSFRSKESLTSFDLGMHFSVRGLGNDQAEFENKRYLAKANYMYATGDVKFLYNLPLGMEVSSHVSGQVADSPLISNEQFSLGGATSVRGYYETMALADDGVFGSLELHSPHLGLESWDYLNKLKLLAFVDVGQGWIQNPLPGNLSGNTLAGAGFGMHFQMWKYLNGMLDVGFPFISLGPVSKGDPRLDFNIATEF
ncbi:ShlB/FhaC/HecB family hemolysin secretion/activation protein [Methylobacter psychrophilus]|uniref:ShlB/FhaC/HecB family hemolysin secretion/activation protein n=1 Tax=Methylobacter psychrophilus TaxID=96941 RepID=UPI0021D50840|nr:ShlB/FhaC/HecB family hemolysin secretion/activation protein [Methylobacter psychrophilus]